METANVLSVFQYRNFHYKDNYDPEASYLIVQLLLNVTNTTPEMIANMKHLNNNVYNIAQHIFFSIKPFLCELAIDN